VHVSPKMLLVDYRSDVYLNDSPYAEHVEIT
jgi:hypothetical protein